MAKAKQFLILFLKFSVTFAIFYLIFSKIELSELSLVLKQINIPIYMAAVLITLFSTLFSAMLIKTILRSIRYKRTFKDMLRINFTSYFYSFLGELGGGIVRWHRISGPGKKRVEALFAIIIENLMIAGTAYIFLALGFLCSGKSFFSHDEKIGFYILLLSIGAILITILTALINKGFASLLKKGLNAICGKERFPLIRQKVDDLFCCLDYFRKHLTFLRSGLLFAMLYQFTGFCGALIIIWSLGVNVPMIAIIWVFPLAFFAQKLPISIYGLGVREGILIYLLGRYGIIKEEALLIGFLIFLCVIIQAFIGGLVELKQDLHVAKT